MFTHNLNRSTAFLWIICVQNYSVRFRHYPLLLNINECFVKKYKNILAAEVNHWYVYIVEYPSIRKRVNKVFIIFILQHKQQIAR